MQLNLFRTYLPDEVVELQYQWTKAIEARKALETKPDYYEMTDGIIDPVFLSNEYHKARRIEMDLFDILCDYSLSYKVFEGVGSYL